MYRGNIPFTEMEKALDLSDVGVMTNCISIVYIINIPVNSEQMYESILLKLCKNCSS